MNSMLKVKYEVYQDVVLWWLSIEFAQIIVC